MCTTVRMASRSHGCMIAVRRVAQGRMRPSSGIQTMDCRMRLTYDAISLDYHSAAVAQSSHSGDT